MESLKLEKFKKNEIEKREMDLTKGGLGNVYFWKKTGYGKDEQLYTSSTGPHGTFSTDGPEYNCK